MKRNIPEWALDLMIGTVICGVTFVILGFFKVLFGLIWAELVVGLIIVIVCAFMASLLGYHVRTGILEK
jgi:hypothetical protein